MWWIVICILFVWVLVAQNHRHCWNHLMMIQTKLFVVYYICNLLISFYTPTWGRYIMSIESVHSFDHPKLFPHRFLCHYLLQWLDILTNVFIGMSYHGVLFQFELILFFRHSQYLKKSLNRYVVWMLRL